MKKVLAIFLALSTLFVLMACNGKTSDNSKESADNSSSAENIVIASGGSSEYTVVWKAGAQGAEKQAVMDLSNKITEVTGATLEMKIDLVIPGEDATLPEKALFVGKVGYDGVKEKWSALGENDYTVTEENGNVYVMGGSEIAIYYAMLHFRNNFISIEDKTVSVPVGYSFTFEGADSREDYINDPNKMLVNWISEFETPDGMLDFQEKRASFADPAGRMMSFAHRGDAMHYPEDSIEGIISAIKMGADCIEVDVRVTKDGVPILLHDETLTRTTNYERVKGTVVNGIQLPTSEKIEDWTFEQLRCLRLKEKDGRNSAKLTDYVIPTLEEVLKVCNNRCMVMMDKIASAAEMRSIVFPICKKLDAYSCVMFCGGMSVSDAFVLRRELKNNGVKESDLPMYLGRMSCKSNSSWQSNIKAIQDGGMISLFRFSGLSDVSYDGMEHLTRMESWILSVKGKVRWQFDSQLGGNGKNETTEFWDRAYELGVNSMMVDDPLAFCKYIAKKHFS
jgi:hypothetical protein